MIPCAVERWAANPAGPQVACPEALLARHPGVKRFSLPVSQRLPADRVRVVQPVFYPELSFQSLSAPEERGISLEAAKENSPVDALLERMTEGESLLLAELPPKTTGELDEELAGAIVAVLGRLLERGAGIEDNGEKGPLMPSQIGVVCAHVSQVNAVRERLAHTLSGVLVETAERFQGLERKVMLAWHPLSGRASLSGFHLDTGRLCVMLSRHRVACVLFGRAGLEEKLKSHVLSGERVLGVDRDEELRGWRANLALLQQLQGRSFSIQATRPEEGAGGRFLETT